MTAAGTSGTGPGWGPLLGGGLWGEPRRSPVPPSLTPPGGYQRGPQPCPVVLVAAGHASPRPCAFARPAGGHGTALISGPAGTKRPAQVSSGRCRAQGPSGGGHSAAPSCPQLQPHQRRPSPPPHLPPRLAALCLSTQQHRAPAGGAPCPVCSPLPPPAPFQRLLFIWAILFCCDPILFFFLFHGPELETMGCSRCWRRGGLLPARFCPRPLSLVPLPVPAAWASLAGKGSWQHLGSSAPNSRPGAELGRWSWL